jgi:hypothetical protein
MRDRLGALDTPPAQLVERRVARHAQQPHLERALAGLVAIELGQQAKEDGLGDVVGTVAVAQHPVGELVDTARVALVEEPHGVAIPIPAAGHSRGRSRVFWPGRRW